MTRKSSRSTAPGQVGGTLLRAAPVPITTGDLTDAELAMTLNALRQLIHSMRRMASRRRRLRLRPNEVLLLLHVQRAPGQSISGVARQLHTDPSAISVLASRLARRGLLRRAKVASDKRMMSIRLSAAGATALRELPSTTGLLPASALRRVPLLERKALAARLLRVAEALDQRTTAGSAPPQLWIARPS